MVSVKRRHGLPVLAYAPAVLATTLGVAACNSNVAGCPITNVENVAASDLIGMYRAAEGGTLDLRPDGSLAGSGVKNYGDPGGRPDLSGPGSWRLGTGSGATRITASFDPTADYPGGYSTELRISGNRSAPWLYIFIGDPDNCHIYRFDRIASTKQSE